MNLLIVFLPFINFLLLNLLGSSIGNNGAIFLSFLIMGSLSLFSIYLFIFFFLFNNYLTIHLSSWFDLGLISIPFSFQFDFTSSIILILVTLVSFLIHVYSTEYMQEDPHLISFISYLSLFTGFMIILITANNLLLLFIGWEGVGICSYLLIGFWFTSIEASNSAVNAMIINSIGDLALICGMILLWYNTGSLEYNVIFACVSNDWNTQMDLALYLFIIGVAGNSAQIGLHMWLPDAMEGPTPVSALIHAATMVTAGIFLIINISPVFYMSNNSLFIIAMLGSITAIISSTIGLLQNDLNNVIAYSTCSQLGFMALICGFSYFDVGLFHLINHGFFNALLFLSAGAIIHGLMDNQDMSTMGTLILSQPFTFVCFIIGSVALAGLPFLSGFFSKDLLIELIEDNEKINFLAILALSATLLTSIYSSSLMFLVFWNENNSKYSSYFYTHEPGLSITLVILILSLASITVGFISKWIILIPYSPPFIQINFNVLPLILTIGGFSCIYFNFYYNTNFNNINYITVFWNNNIYSMLVLTWYFDIIFNHYIINPTLNFAFNSSYNTIDNQILEYFGPHSLSLTPSFLTAPLSNWANGDLFLYLIYIIIVFSIFFLLNN